MLSEDTAGRRGPPHTGGRWQGTTEPGRLYANGRLETFRIQGQQLLDHSINFWTNWVKIQIIAPK